MSRPFEMLRRQLLESGMAPSRVGRTLGELEDHLSDLVDAALSAGMPVAEAEAVALRRLGELDVLAEAMLARPEFRSWAARAPWLLPAGALLALAAGYLLSALVLVGAVRGFGTLTEGHIMPPGWLPSRAETLFGFDHIALPVLIGWGIAVTAARQRLAVAWPLISVITVAIIGAGLGFTADWPATPRRWAISIGTPLFTPTIPMGWAEYAGSALVILLCTLVPAGIAVRMRCGIAPITPEGRSRLRLTAVLTALCAGLIGCTAAGPDDVLSRAAEGKSEGGAIVVAAGTPRDSLAMQAAQDRIERDLASAKEPAPADPPVAPGAEQIAVVGPRSFAGIWRMVSPTSLASHYDQGATYDHVQTFICRFEQHAAALSGACLPERKKIEGSVDGDRVTLDWSRGLVSAGMIGTLLSPNDFQGTLSIGALGIRVPTDIPAYGSKLGRSIEPQDNVQIAGRVLHDLVDGSIADDRFTAAARIRFQDTPPLDARDRRALGSPIDQIFLDRIDVLGAGDGSNQTMDVYELSFEKGWRLCGVVLNAAQKVEAIECS